MFLNASTPICPHCGFSNGVSATTGRSATCRSCGKRFWNPTHSQRVQRELRECLAGLSEGEESVLLDRLVVRARTRGLTRRRTEQTLVEWGMAPIQADLTVAALEPEIRRHAHRNGFQLLGLGAVLVAIGGLFRWLGMPFGPHLIFLGVVSLGSGLIKSTTGWTFVRFDPAEG